MKEYKLTPLGQKMVEDNYGLACYIAYHYCSDSILHIQDRLSAAAEGLIHAVATYKHGRGKLNNYITLLVKQEIEKAKWSKTIAITYPYCKRLLKDKEKVIQESSINRRKLDKYITLMLMENALSTTTINELTI